MGKISLRLPQFLGNIFGVAKSFRLKKKGWNLFMPAVFSALIVFILFAYQNCGKAPMSNVILPTVQSAFSDDQTREYYYVSDSSPDKISHLVIKADSYSLYLKQVDSNGAEILQENHGALNYLSDGQIKVVYNEESCNAIGEEVIKIKILPDQSIELMNLSGAYLLKKISKNDRPYLAESASPFNNLARCSSSPLKNNAASLEVRKLISETKCVTGIRNKYITQLKTQDLKIGFSSGSLFGEVEKSFLGYGLNGDIVIISRLKGYGYNISASFCSDISDPKLNKEFAITSFKPSRALYLDDSLAFPQTSFYSFGVELSFTKEGGEQNKWFRDYDYAIGHRPLVTISPPSLVLTGKTPVKFDVRISNFDAFDMFPGYAKVIATGTARADLAWETDDYVNVKVSFVNIWGDGTLQLYVKEGLAVKNSGTRNLPTYSSIVQVRSSYQ